MLYQMLITEIDYKPKRYVKYLHVRKGLHPKALKITPFNRLGLNDKAIVDNEISAKREGFKTLPSRRLGVTTFLKPSQLLRVA